MKITWIGHSCFKIEEDGYAIIIDPYEKGYLPGLLPVNECADEVLCTHEHGDHNGRGEVKLKEGNKRNSKSPFTVEILDTFHDEVEGAKRGKNKIFLISDGKQKIAHFGDLGCEPTPEQKAKLTALDWIFVPVGGYFTIDGKQAADLMKELKPKHIIPMHYRNDQAGIGFEAISEVTAFTEQMDSVMQIDASEVDTEEKYAAQTLVLRAARTSVG